ncbi:molecular chaperone TorD family protein [Salipaludibacillus sp. CUR1]|uniref:molecular chaperone TorD family protein n=1 Tax=Salipaludibacillus sp. CUR1 TaxID=2820003 RepID=UPI001E59A002|nr:molecular chaperone TorD family protein [Salipaludibacillus sp. CUR1]MCE7790830.1 molecular chaperone TorD family protein [Salipaludibacillus sp. CUR1]
MTTADHSIEEKSLLYLVFARVMYGETDFLINLVEEYNEGLAGLDESLLNVLHQVGTTPEEELAFQYDNLFFIPGSHYVPPFAGTFIYPDNQEGEEAFLQKLAALYEREGFMGYAEKKYLRHDHIGHLLMFLHFLLMKRENTGLNEKEKIDSTMKDLLEDVLGPAFGEFERRVSEQLKKGFYLDVIRQMHQFIDCEHQMSMKE